MSRRVHSSERDRASEENPEADPTTPAPAVVVAAEVDAVEEHQLVARPWEYTHQRYAEGHLCCALCCFSDFVFWPRTCFYTEIDTNIMKWPYCWFPCVGHDGACPPESEGNVAIPKTCTFIPGLPSPMLYPRVVCFPRVREVYPEIFSDDAARLGVDKKNYRILCSCCLPNVLSTNFYFVNPMESFFVKESECLCLGAFCSLPRIERHPLAIAIFGLVLYPKVDCCPRMDEMFPQYFIDSEQAESRRLMYVV